MTDLASDPLTLSTEGMNDPSWSQKGPVAWAMCACPLIMLDMLPKSLGWLASVLRL